jgi:O-methyltransferase
MPTMASENRMSGKDLLRAVHRRLPVEVRLRRGRSPSGTFGTYDLAEQIDGAAALARPNSMLSSAGFAILYQQVTHLEREQITGALVECGVWHGGSAALMARSSLDHGRQTRALHLYDSFEGIPEPDAEIVGRDHANGRLQIAFDYADRGGPGSEGDVRALLRRVGYDNQAVHVHQGWFQDTVPATAASIGPIALLHMDGDWYESTRVCLDHLYEHVVRGGFVMVNDYGAYQGCRKAVDEFLDTLSPRPFLAHVDHDIRYWIK